jgi:hypothetical protein
MSYKIAGIDIHKRMVAVVIADVAGEGEYQFERRKFGGGGEQLRLLAEWLVTNEIEEVVMESTAQYWKPVWEALERDWQPVSRARGTGAKSGSLLWAQAKSNRAPRAQERLCRCRTPAQTAGRERASAEFCTRHGATPLEDRLAAEAAVDACPGAVTESVGSTAGTGPSEAIESRLGSVRGQRTADVASASRRGKRPGPA